MLGVLALLAPAPAAAQDPPVQMSVTVVPPSGTQGPRPTGDVIVSVNGRRVLTAPLTSLTNPVTTATPLLTGAVSLLGQQVTIAYSGDSNYEASDGTTVTFPTSGILEIVAKPKDAAAPTIEINSPGDGVRYARGEPVVAIYSCRDPDDRSARHEVLGFRGFRQPGEHRQSGHVHVRRPKPGCRRERRDQDRDVHGRSPRQWHGAATPATACHERPEPFRAAGFDAAPSAGLAPTAIAVISSPDTKRKPNARSSASPKSGGGAAPAPAETPKPPPAPAAAQEFAPYDPRSEPKKAVGVLVATFALLQLGGGGLALAGAVRAGTGGRRAEKQDGGDDDSPSSGPSPSMEYEGVDIEYLAARTVSCR